MNYRKLVLLIAIGFMPYANALFAVDEALDPPEANFTVDPVSGEAPLTVTFTDASSGEISSRLWDFGDGGTSPTSNATITKIYHMAGTYTVTLTVTHSGGSDTHTLDIAVTEVTELSADAQELIEFISVCRYKSASGEPNVQEALCNGPHAPQGSWSATDGLECPSFPYKMNWCVIDEEATDNAIRAINERLAERADNAIRAINERLAERAETVCTEAGGSWENGACTAAPAPDSNDATICTEAGGSWENGACTAARVPDSNDATVCANAGGMWNAGTSTCTPSYDCYLGGFCSRAAIDSPPAQFGYTNLYEGHTPGTGDALATGCNVSGPPNFGLDAWEDGVDDASNHFVEYSCLVSNPTIFPIGSGRLCVPCFRRGPF